MSLSSVTSPSIVTWLQPFIECDESLKISFVICFCDLLGFSGPKPFEVVNWVRKENVIYVYNTLDFVMLRRHENSSLG